MVDSKRLYPHRLAKSAFMAVSNITGRTWRHTSKNLTRARRHFLHRARYSSAGRAMLAVTEAVTSPRDAIQRRNAAAAYNRTHADMRLDRRDGYAMLPPGSVANTDEIIALSLSLFEEKQRQLEAAAGSSHSKKWAFLRSILTNQDLASNPKLVDFALSDSLLGLVTNYLGTIPHLNRIDLLYSVNHGGEEAISSQIYHLDPEGTRQAKLFMNLRDVGPAEGPFTFIPASETTRIVNAIKKRRLEDTQMAAGRYSDDELEAVGGLKKAISVDGPKGSAALVDTSRCLHFGSRVKPGTYRLCLYIQYCTSREHGNMFDASRHANDPVRYLALINSARSPQGAVAAPHQMG
ncbi:MAG TPA: hypothetical protein VFO21_27200 [Vicinamibacterales bacterium]|nr:hypothetical protein [Vicinamibacterales bacterium]